MLSAYQLRHHLAIDHDIRIVGADYATLVTLHDVEHRAHAGHEHDDGPGSRSWGRECDEFGCHGAARVAALEYMILVAVVLAAAWVYWAAGL